MHYSYVGCLLGHLGVLIKVHGTTLHSRCVCNGFSQASILYTVIDITFPHRRRTAAIHRQGRCFYCLDCVWHLESRMQCGERNGSLGKDAKGTRGSDRAGKGPRKRPMSVGLHIVTVSEMD